MRTKPYIIAVIALIIFIYAIYGFWFYIKLDYKLSSDPATWGQLGDYAGGILNPLLSLISIALLIKSLVLQRDSNEDLKKEIRNNERAERLRSFEVLFFNLIESQKNLFDSFCIEPQDFPNICAQLKKAKAVIEIENHIYEIRQKNGTDSDIAAYLNELDADDQIFGLLRAFYVTVRITNEKLGELNGFSAEDRTTHFKALINFTDFAQLRLVMLSTQFLDYESAKYLRSSTEFLNVLDELGLSCKLY